jgi:hypothetical protein
MKGMDATATAVVAIFSTASSTNRSALIFTSAFHVACNNAANKTAKNIPKDIDPDPAHSRHHPPG